ncbi:hypothetical protein E2542_SST01036 [Spatholobus suberectus]|nr:hypothetical protein E2542_SST01036 [Spatholobus suberectus]
MEQEKNKRAREDDGVEIESSFENNNNAKKRNIYGISFTEDKEVEDKDCFKARDSHLAMGVFDFPWLKDGVISKSDECLDFEDNFLSSLERQDTSFNAGVDFSEEYGLCETPEASISHIPEAKLVEDMWQPFESNGLEPEAEDGDCIWSFLLNKPL